MSGVAIGSLFGGILCLGLSIAPIPFQKYAMLRCGAAVGAIGCFSLGHFEAGRQKKMQAEFDRLRKLEEEQQQAIDEMEWRNFEAIEQGKREALVIEGRRKEEARIEVSLADYTDDVQDAYVLVQDGKGRLDRVLARLQPDPESEPEPEQVALPEPEPEPEPETKEKIESLAAKKTKLLKLINGHEGGWIGQLMKKPVLIYGDQGSGKSYFAEFLALCRHYLRGHQIVSIADPHFHQNKDECWKELVKLKTPGFGAHHNYKEVDSQILAMYDRFAKRTLKDSPITSIFDEVTRYGQEEATQESASKLGSKLSSDPRKAKESPILIAHAKTLAALGGGEGFADAIQGNFIRIKLNSDSEQEPLWRGTISGIKDGDGEPIENQKISITADWIRSSWVYDLFNSQESDLIADVVLEPQKPPVTIPEPERESDADKLDRILNHPISDDYWLQEMSPELLDRAIEMRNTQMRQVSESETSISEVASADTIQDKDSLDSEIQRLVAEKFPKTTEKALFDSIKKYSETSLSASKIIKVCLKCSHPKADSPRSYKYVGKPVFIYLIRKYGEASFIAQFADYLDKE